MCLYVFLFKLPPFQTATKLPTWSIFGVVLLGSKKNNKGFVREKEDPSIWMFFIFDTTLNL